MCLALLSLCFGIFFCCVLKYKLGRIQKRLKKRKARGGAPNPIKVPKSTGSVIILVAVKPVY